MINRVSKLNFWFLCLCVAGIGPLPVRNLTATLPSLGTEGITSVSDLILSWSPDARSQQDSYQVTFQEVVELGGDANSVGVTGLNAADASVIVTASTQLVLTSLLPGRNYSLSVISLTGGMESKPVVVYQATRTFPCILFNCRFH